jgi:hypothetical protein
MDFPYTEIPTEPVAALPQRSMLHRPILNVLLRKNGKAITAKSMIDSGSDACLFPASFARTLGITIPNLRILSFSGTSDARQAAYFETVQATIWNNSMQEEPITFDLEAGFCTTLEHVGFGLLGQEGFFSRFPISFDLPNGLFRVG